MQSHCNLLCGGEKPFLLPIKLWFMQRFTTTGGPKSTNKCRGFLKDIPGGQCAVYVGLDHLVTSLLLAKTWTTFMASTLDITAVGWLLVSYVRTKRGGWDSAARWQGLRRAWYMMACRGAVHCSFKCQASRSYRSRLSSIVSNPPLFEFVAMFMAETSVASLNLDVLNQICSVI